MPEAQEQREKWAFLVGKCRIAKRSYQNILMNKSNKLIICVLV